MPDYVHLEHDLALLNLFAFTLTEVIFSAGLCVHRQS
jgi:hypothetical protein